MAYDPQLRASDEDRDRTASLLREHHAQGRLTSEEFDDRLDATFAAKTIGELDKLLKDLPSIDLYRLPEARLTRQPRQAQPQPSRQGATAWRAVWAAWLALTVLCFVVWAVAGFGPVWPLWVAAPSGALLAGTYVTFRAVGGGRRQLGSGSGQNQLPGGQDPRV